MATIKEIARLAGVSRGTVDRVLNKRGSVSPETASRVREIAESLSYTPNLAGKTLAVKKKQLKFGFILFGSTRSNPFFLDVVKGIESRAEVFKEYSATVELRYATIDNPDLQVRLIDDLVDIGIDGLCITPINHPLVTERIKKLSQSGIPVITSNSDIPDCGRLAYVGSDYFRSGQTAAGMMNLVCQGEARIGIVIGSPLVLCHSERVAGFTKYAKNNFPGLEILNTVINNDEDGQSYEVTYKMLKEMPEINAIYLAAAGVEGACRAVDDLGLPGKIRIICHDTTAPICALIKDGSIVASIAQEPFAQGAKPLDILMDYVGMGIMPSKEFYFTKNEIKIKENI